MSEANQAQRDFWSGETARTWLALEAEQDLTFQPVTDWLIATARIGPAHRVLDVGCGTGASTFPAGQRAAMAHGVDISPVMLERARRTVREQGIANVTFDLADAQSQGFDKPFDILISRFGMMFFADPVAAFENLRRALGPGGRMHFVCWGPMSENPWFDLPRRVAAERFGAVAPADPHAPGPMAFADRSRVVALMSKAGLADASSERVEFLLTPTGDTVGVARLLTELGPVAAAMRNRNGTADDLEAMRGRVIEGLGAYATTHGVRVPAILNHFTATA